VALQAKLERIAKGAGARVGVAALHLETGLTASLNGTSRFPMASTVKIPVAVQLLALVDEGVILPATMVALERHHIHPGHGPIWDFSAERFDGLGVAFSIQELFGLMMIESDNSASDFLFNLVGGPASVIDRLGTIGIIDISIDRSTLELIADAFGVSMPSDDTFINRERWRALQRATPPERRAAARQAFFADTRDTVTPYAMVQLLAAIYRREALSREQTDVLLDAMMRCATGNKRMKRLLPSGTWVAHKTGTFQIGICNDVGIIYLPHSAGHLAVAVFITESNSSETELDWLIARITREVYKSFVSISLRRT
jgi:beta-lactamase class A